MSCTKQRQNWMKKHLFTCVEGYEYQTNRMDEHYDPTDQQVLGKFNNLHWPY